MNEPTQIVQTEEQAVAVIRLTIPRIEIQQAMGPAIGEVLAVVNKQGAGPAGPVFSHHFSMDPATFDFEVGVPVTKPIEPSGRVQPGKLLAAKVARMVYQGSYEHLGTAWGEFGQWLTANGHKPAADLWERYLAGPESSPNPADWRTELNRPLLE